MMNVEQLYKALKKSQEAKGIYFNKDQDLVFELLDALIANNRRYGYMACYCGLYTSSALHHNEIEVRYIPERRPPEKIF